MMKLRGAFGAVILALLVLAYASAYVVDETEQVVVTQFGKVIGKPKVEPGLKFKLPYPVQEANYFPKNLQEWDGDPGQIPTLDKTFLWVDAFARWRIVDPVRFFQTVGDELGSRARLDDIIDPAVRNLVTSFPLVETVRKSDRDLANEFEQNGTDPRAGETDVFGAAGYRIDVGREEITRQILAQAQPKLDKFGIELVDVKIKRINYVEEVRKSVYARMIAERNQIAEKFRSEGQGEAQKIRGEKERELKRIESEAYRDAQKLKGEADAMVTRTLAEAYGVDPEFFSFLKTMEAYKETLGENSRLVLSTDSEFLKYLTDRPGVK